MSKQKQDIDGFVGVSFTKDGNAEFDINTKDLGQVLTVIMGLEGYFCTQSGLDVDDMREIMDEKKSQGLEVKPLERDVIDG